MFLIEAIADTLLKRQSFQELNKVKQRFNDIFWCPYEAPNILLLRQLLGSNEYVDYSSMSITPTYCLSNKFKMCIFNFTSTLAFKCNF